MSEEERREVQKRSEDLDRLRRYEEAGWEKEPGVQREEEGKAYEMRRGPAAGGSRWSGEDRTDHPAWSGSYYSEAQASPQGRASPESYWNEPYREPPARRARSAEPLQKRTARLHPVKKTRAVKHAEAPSRPVAARQERVHRELVHEPPRESTYREPLGRPIHRTSPFDVRGREPAYEAVRYTEAVPERYVERYEIGPDGKERLLSSRRIGAPESTSPGASPSERSEGSREPERRAETGRSVLEGEREWTDPRDTGRLGGRARTAWSSASERGQRYGTEAAGRGQDLGRRISEWGRGAGSRAEGWSRDAGERAREAAAGREFEDSAYRAGSALGAAIRKVTSVSRELGSGFREGMGDEYPRGGGQELRERAREGYREEEARHREGAPEGGRPPRARGERASEEEDVPHRGARGRGRGGEAYGEVKERPPSKRASSTSKKAASVPSKAKRTASTAKRKAEKAEKGR